MKTIEEQATQWYFLKINVLVLLIMMRMYLARISTFQLIH